jgi:Lamin Tail Domain
MTHATRFTRPAAGCLAAGLAIPLLFFPQPTRLNEPLPTATASGPALAETAISAQETEAPSPAPSLTLAAADTPAVSESATPTPDVAAPSETIETYESAITASSTVGSTDTLTPAVTESATPTPDVATPSETVETYESAITASSTVGSTDTQTPAAPLPRGPSPHDPMAIVINEVAWSGTAASSNDEWIELHNPGSAPIDLDGWLLTDGGDIRVLLSGTVGAYGFFLLERTDDTTVRSLPADHIYTGALSNDGETLGLLDPAGALIDSANAGGGRWPAGDVAGHTSMERLAGPDGPGVWRSFTGCWSTGTDADGNPLHGTPLSPSSVPCTEPTPTTLPTATPTPSPTNPAASIAPLAVLINEVAWSGTVADASDEWLELHNPGPEAVSLDGWRLTDGHDLQVALKGTLPAYGFYLLERTSDQTVADIAADQIYTGGLNNSGETLELLDPAGALIDSANADGGGWPAGSDQPRRSMERRGGDDRRGNWATFPGYGGVGRDAEGNAIGGTPRQPNAINLPEPTATGMPSRVVINEVLIRPHYDWEGAGGVSTDDEFIELYNAGDLPVRMLGWVLDDVEGAGSSPFELGDAVLQPHSYLAYFRRRTHLALNDTGDTVRLLEPGGRLIDQISYLRVRAKNLSYGRLPDGGHHLRYGLWPTAGGPNQLFVAPTLPLPILDNFTCPAGHLHPLLFRYPDHPLALLHASQALTTCP